MKKYLFIALAAFTFFCFAPKSHAAVSVLATSTEVYSHNVTSTNYTLTVPAGSNEALVVTLNFGISGGVSNITATWDNGGTNQVMTQLVDKQLSSSESTIFGLRNPTVKTNGTLRVTWTTTATDLFVSSIVFGGVDQASDGNAFPTTAKSPNSNTASTTIASVAGNMVVAVEGSTVSQGTSLGTLLYDDHVSGAVLNSMAEYDNGATTVSVGNSGTNQTIAAVSVAQPHTFSYYRAITVTSTASVASGTNTNFPMEVSSTLTSWESTSTGAGARIQNLCTAPAVDSSIQEPCDLVFGTSTPTASGAKWNCGSFLNYETDSYTSSTGALQDWVNVPSVSTGTTIYACYGDASTTVDLSQPAATWNSNYAAVYHFKNGTVLNASDSTANANNLTTNVGEVATTTGMIDGGVANSNGGGNNNLKTDTAAATTTPLTMELWVNPSSYNGGVPLSILDHNGGSWNGFYLGEGNGVSNFNFTTVSNNFASFDSAGNVSGTAAGTWNYVVGVTANSASRYAYVNGVQGTQGTGNVTPGTAPTGIGVGASVRGGVTDNAINGAFDEARVLTTALSSSWILTEYNNQSAPDAAQYANGFYSVGAEQAGSGGTVTTGEGPILFSCYQMKSYMGKFQ
jgi:hypothetical protein